MQKVYRLMMEFKRIGLLFLFALIMTSVDGQILKPANWNHNLEKEVVRIGDEIDLIFSVTIDQYWYLYSTDFDPDLGPMVTEFTFLPNDSYELIGTIQPIGAKKKYDEIWEGEYTYFKEKAEFRQTIRVLKGDFGVRF